MLVIHSDPAGEPFAFSVANTSGSMPSFAARYGISAANNVQLRNAPATEMTSPIRTRTEPQGPTTCSSTLAIDADDGRPASSGWLMTPKDNSDTQR